jgi:hypothetical protein
MATTLIAAAVERVTTTPNGPDRPLQARHADTSALSSLRRSEEPLKPANELCVGEA